MLGALLGLLLAAQPAVSPSAASDANRIPSTTRLLPPGGAAGVNHQADVPNSPYYRARDYFRMKSEGSLTLLPGFATTQQTTEWTCGPAAALMVLHYFGRDEGLGEMDLVPLRKNYLPGATTLRQMIHIFEGMGGLSLYSTYDLKDPEHLDPDFIRNTLKAGHPIIIGTDTWGGHWQVIIGYDTMGTETTADDVLILADPYDTTDHLQDGYVVESFERLSDNWRNSFDPDFHKNVFLAVGKSDDAPVRSVPPGRASRWGRLLGSLCDPVSLGFGAGCLLGAALCFGVLSIAWRGRGGRGARGGGGGAMALPKFRKR